MQKISKAVCEDGVIKPLPQGHFNFERIGHTMSKR